MNKWPTYILFFHFRYFMIFWMLVYVLHITLCRRESKQFDYHGMRTIYLCTLGHRL